MALQPVSSGKNTVQSLVKGLKVLEAFSQQRSQMTLAEIARATEMDNATVFRLLNTLEQEGYVIKDSGNRQFRLSFKVMNLGFVALGHDDLRSQSRPILRSLVGKINEAASIGVLDGAEVVYIERVQAGIARLGIDIRIGSRVPVYSSAIGQALIAWMPEEEQVRVLESSARPALTDTTLIRLDDLLERLKQIRKAGFAISNQETVSGVYVIACPILDVDQLPIAAISVAAPVFCRPLEAFVNGAVKPLQEAAYQIEQMFHASGSVASQKSGSM